MVKEVAGDEGDREGAENPGVQECGEWLQSTQTVGTAEYSREGLAVEIRIDDRGDGTGTPSCENPAAQCEGDAVSDKGVDESSSIAGLQHPMDHRQAGAEVYRSGRE